MPLKVRERGGISETFGQLFKWLENRLSVTLRRNTRSSLSNFIPKVRKESFRLNQRPINRDCCMKQFPGSIWISFVYYTKATLPKTKICQPSHSTPHRYLSMHLDQIKPYLYHESATIPSNYPELLNLLWGRRVIWSGTAICSIFYYRSLKKRILGGLTPHPRITGK